MHIAIVGGTGFVGRNLAEALVARGHSVTAISRSRPEGFEDFAEFRFRSANVTDAGSLAGAFGGAEVVVYSVGLLRENRAVGQSFEAVQLQGAANSVQEAQAAGVRRFILLSANGVRDDGTSYQSTKLRAEQIVQASNLEYSIFRPSVIFGDSKGSQEFSLQLYRDIVKPPLPAPEFLARWLPPRKAVTMSPVAIGDVVDAMVRQIEDPLKGENIFELGGPDDLTWREMLERIAEATHRRKRFIPVPISLMKIPAALFGRFRFFPVSLDQLKMLAEGNVAPVDTLLRLVDREPLRFEPRNLKYLNNETV